MSLMISFSLHSIPSSHPNLWYGIIDIEFSPFQGLLWSSCCQNEHRMRRATRCSSFCVLYVVSWCYLYAWMSSALVDNNISYRIGFLYTSTIFLLWYLSDVCSIRNCQLASTLYASTPTHPRLRFEERRQTKIVICGMENCLSSDYVLFSLFLPFFLLIPPCACV